MVMTIATARGDRLPRRSPPLDYAWQRHKHDKGLKMDKEEIKQEFKQQGFLPKSNLSSADGRWSCPARE